MILAPSPGRSRSAGRGLHARSERSLRPRAAVASWLEFCKRLGEPHRLAARQLFDRVFACGAGLLDLLQQRVEREAQRRDDLDQAADPDADRALLVFLDLLYGDTDAPGERRL